MNLFTITGEIVLRGKEQVEKQLVNLQGTTNSVTNKMETSFKRLGGIILTAFSVRAIKNFALTLAETSANVHEEIAQFNSVLGDFANEMTKRIKNVTKETGIMEERLRRTATSVYAMFHGAGMEAEVALNETERFLKIVADASAFYDKSTDVVMGDLQSFMRGVTRAGYSLGLYTSELQRNEKATQMFGKTYDKLNQVQRYNVMLDIVEQTYRLSGVTGQATRESEQWLNVTSNLQEAWKQFMASIGEPVMNKLLPPIKKITDTLKGWTARFNELKEWWTKNGKIVDEMKEKFATLAVAFGLATVTLAGLTILKNIGNIIQWIIKLLSGNWLTIVVAGLSLIAVEVIKLYNTSEDFRNNLNVLIDSIKLKINNIVDWFTSVPERVQTILQTIKKYVVLEFHLIQKEVQDVISGIGDFFKRIINWCIQDIQNGINGIVNAINIVLKVGNKIPAVNIPLLNSVSIPKLATGGDVRKSTIAMIGEAGAEAVIPYTNVNAMKNLAVALANAINNTFDFSGGSKTTNVVESLWKKIESSSIYKSIAKVLGFNISESIKGRTSGGGGRNYLEDWSLDENGTWVQSQESIWNRLWINVQNGWKKTWQLMFGGDSDQQTQMQVFFGQLSERFEKITSYVSNYVTPLFDAITSLQDQRAEQEIDALEKELTEMQETHEAENELAQESHDAQLKDLYKMLDLGQILYEDYVSAVSKADAELEAEKQARLDEEAEAEQELLEKKDALARKQFEAEKKTNIAMVWVNTATAIMKAFAELGVIGGAIATALLLATAGIQTATIAEQQYEPMLATGGVIDKPTHALIGEDGAEAVVPLEKNLGWVNGLANALEPAISTVNIDYTPHLQTISEQIDEMKQLLATFLPQFTQNIVLDGVTVARQLTPYLDSSLGQRQRLANRGM